MTEDLHGVWTRIALAGAVVVVTVALLMGNAALASGLADGRSMPLGPVELRLDISPGISFGVGAGPAVWIGMTALTSGAVVLGLLSAPRLDAVSRVGLTLAVAGAAANLVDRADDGLVTDYLHHAWLPTFNLDDVLVVVGVVLILAGRVVSLLDGPRRRGPREPQLRNASTRRSSSAAASGSYSPREGSANRCPLPG
ncbi:signal peptidase II [Actinokineospora sp. G85]|uniref:signal peptidase II n=1 Tax=Actinokineospora sp. G85 TaxID=3406626 RepID=UPI003C79268A